MPKMVYHSMPLECVKNKLYQKEFIARFDSSVIHILDCAETNREEYAKQRAVTLSNMIKEICPPLIPISKKQLQNNDSAWTNFTSNLARLQPKISQAELGLVC